MVGITWESIGLILSVITGTISILVKLNQIENEYQAGKSKQEVLEVQLVKVSKDLEILGKEAARIKAQSGREFNNVAWQLRIIIGSLKDVEKFLENSTGFVRRKGAQVINEEEDTRGFMLKKIKELDSSEEDEQD